LYNAFAGDADTLAGYIQRQRLAACMRELREDPQGARAITEIALSSGFSNLSHFSRVFREHAGMSPSEFRQSCRRRA
jgi:AraC-like DNA-binding protein